VPRRDHPPVEPASGKFFTPTPARAPSRRRGAAANVESAGAANLPSAALRDAECAALLRELETNALEYQPHRAGIGISRNTLYRKIHKHNIVLEQ